MRVEENKALVRRFTEEFRNRGDLAVADELLAPNYVLHAGLGGDIHGPEGMKQDIVVARSAFPDLHITIDDMVAEGDKVASRWTIRGTHRGAHTQLGIAPTGKQVTGWGMSIDRIVGGKIVETWNRYDSLGLMQQLEAVTIKTASK